MKLEKLLIIGLLLLQCLLFWKIDLVSFLVGKVQLWDFDVYYQTAVDVRKGAHPYQLNYMQTAGPPLVITPFLPFSYLPIQVARSIFTILSLLSVFGTSWLLAKKIFTKDPLPFLLILNVLFTILFQIRFNLLLGQPNLILMFIITYLLMTQSKISGILWGAIILIKTHYIIALLALFRKSWLTIVTTTITLIFIAALTLPIIKSTYYFDYIQTRLSQHIAQPLMIGDVGYYNQSLRATLARLKIPNSYALVSIVLLLFGSWYLLISSDKASGFIVALLVSPVVWQHYMVLAYPILFLTAVSFAKQKKLPWYIVISAILLLSHIPWLHEKPTLLPLGILASHYYFGILLLFYSRLRLYFSYTTLAGKT